MTNNAVKIPSVKTGVIGKWCVEEQCGAVKNIEVNNNAVKNGAVKSGKVKNGAV